MTFTNETIISSIQTQLSISEDRASQLLESVLEIMRSTLANGEQIEMSGFGRFSVHTREFKKKNLMTVIHKTVSFRCASNLRRKLNDLEWVQCPKCQGKGMKRYEYYDVYEVLEAIIKFKSEAITVTEPFHRFELVLLCPICKGNGMIDWVENMMSSSPFGDLDGCLEPFMRHFHDRLSIKIAGFKWKGLHFLNGVSPWNSVKRKNGLTDLEGVIEASRQRYVGCLKLTKEMLSKGIEELKRIEQISKVLVEMIDEDFDSNLVQRYLVDNGLGEYVPDVYAFPKEDDLLAL